MHNGQCFFCHSNLVHYEPGFESDFCECAHCGRYRRRHGAIWAKPEKMTAWTSAVQVRNARIGGDVDISWKRNASDDSGDLLWENSPAPLTMPTDFLWQIDEILLNIGYKVHFSPLEEWRPSEYDFGLFYLQPDEPFYNSESEGDAWKGKIRTDIVKIRRILIQQGYLEETETATRGCPFPIQLAPGGLKRLRQLRENIEERTQPFVAMWFSGDSVFETYRQCLRKACIGAGYTEPYLVNEQCYNGNIAVQILTQIRQSRFLIADLTCEHEAIKDGQYSKGVRGGVYFEAGYAKGLGIPVILTCRKDTFDEDMVHFDLKQFNTILWRMDSENGILVEDHTKKPLDEYLQEWILATVGHKHQRNNSNV